MIERVKRIIGGVRRGIGKALGTKGRKRNIRAISSLRRPKGVKSVRSLGRLGEKEEDS